MLNQRLVSPTSQALWLNAQGCVFTGRLCLVSPPCPLPQPQGGAESSSEPHLAAFLSPDSLQGKGPPTHLIMSRRSQRLTRYSSQGDDDGGSSSSSGGSSVMGSQSTLFKDSPLR